MRTKTFRKLLEDMGLTPSLMEAQTGVSERTVYRAMAGHEVNRSTAMAFARALGQSVESVEASIEAGAEEAA